MLTPEDFKLVQDACKFFQTNEPSRRYTVEGEAPKEDTHMDELLLKLEHLTRDDTVNEGAFFLITESGGIVSQEECAGDNTCYQIGLFFSKLSDVQKFQQDRSGDPLVANARLGFGAVVACMPRRQGDQKS